MKLIKIIAPCVILIAAIVVLIFLVKSPGAEVIFVPGWQSKGYVSKLVKKEIKEIFSAKKVTIHKWKSEVKWSEAKNNAEKEAELLCEKISKMSPDAQERLILIGHSLGARVVVRTAKHLKEKNIKVKQVILLGAAVNYDDQDFQACDKISIQPFINVYNRNDYVLKIAYGNKEKTLAAGFSGIKGTVQDVELKNMKQYRKHSKYEDLFAGFFEHQNHEYIEFLSDIVNGMVEESIEKVSHHDIEINYGLTKGIFSLPKNTFIVVPDADKEELYYDWKFCQYGDSKHAPKLYLIINPYGEVKFTPLHGQIQKVWKSIKEQIDSQIAAANNSAID